MPCPKCGDEDAAMLDHTVLRAVQIKARYTCDYEKFEPWEVVGDRKMSYPDCENCLGSVLRPSCVEESAHDLVAPPRTATRLSPAGTAPGFDWRPL